MRLQQNLRRPMGQKPNLTYTFRIESHEERHHVARSAMPRRHRTVVAHPFRSILVLCRPVFGFGCHSCKRIRLSWTSFITPTDRALAALVVRVAFVAVFSVDPAAFWCDVSGLTSNVALHGLENGCLNPS